MTEPKLADPIVFNYQKSHIKLLANRLTLNTNKQALMRRQSNINEDITSTFRDPTDTTNLRASDQLYVTLNKPGVYQITANTCHDSSGTAVTGLTIDVAFPAQAPSRSHTVRTTSITSTLWRSASLSECCPPKWGPKSASTPKPLRAHPQSGVTTTQATPTMQVLRRVVGSISCIRVPRR